MTEGGIILKLSELEQFTYSELEQLTIRDLESDISEVLARYYKSELPLTPQMVKKLSDMANFFPEVERPKFFSIKTVADALMLMNELIEFCTKTGLDDLLHKTLSPLIREFLDTLKELI